MASYIDSLKEIMNTQHPIHPDLIAQFMEIKEVLADQENVKMLTTTGMSVSFLVNHPQFDNCSYANACQILLERYGYQSMHHHSNFDKAVYLIVAYNLTKH